MHRNKSRRLRLLLTVLLIGLILPKGYAQSLLPSSALPERGEIKAEGGSVTKSAQGAESLSPFLAGTPSMGDPDARVAIIEFGDYQCPICNEHANQTLPQIVTNYVKTGKVRYFFKDTPVEAIHPQALKASEAALCAGEQGRYWEMHDRLFQNPLALAAAELPRHARAVGLDIPRFQQCLDQNAYAVQIRKDIQDAVKSGVRGTPTFYLQMLKPADPGKNTVISLSGFKPFSVFQQTLDHMLNDVER
jgi:protein-disulfide isomerase